MTYIGNLHLQVLYTYSVFKLVKLWKAEASTYTKPALKIFLQNNEVKGHYNDAHNFLVHCSYTTVTWIIYSITAATISFNTKHLMTGPKENSEFCFPETLNVSQGKTKGNIEIKGKQNSLFPTGPVIECFEKL